MPDSIANRIYGNMARRTSFKAHAPRLFLPPHRFHQPRLRSKCEEEDQSRWRAAFLLGFTDAKRRVGEEVAACRSEARDL